MKKEKLKVNNEKITNQNAITLIALIITIIILLILAAVTINLTIGENGIFKTAKEAALNYANAAEYERTEIENFFNEAQNIINGGTENNNPPTTPIVAVNDLKAGDYIKYDTGNSEVGDNGIITCRVLYPVSSEYGLQIISDENVKVIELGIEGNTWEEGKNAYNNAIENLNNEAESFVNSNYAHDARCVGSIPTVENGIFVDKDKHNGETGTVSIPSSYTMPNGWSSRDTGCYKTDTNYETDKAQMENFGLLDNGSAYWMASRYSGSAGSDAGYSENYFAVRIFMRSLGVYHLQMMNVDNSGVCNVGPAIKSGIRPCISLKSDTIKIISGDGESEDTAYVIGK